MNTFTDKSKFLMILAIMLGGAIFYFGYTALGGTNIATTLNLFGSGTTLDDGLVGHWTFDGVDIDEVASSSATSVTITIDSANIGSTLSNFPVFVDLADMPSEFWSGVTGSCGDIRVYADASQTTELPREVVDCDTSGETGELHFRADSISSSADEVFYLHWDGSSSDYAIDATYGAENVWTNDYVMVHHLNEGDSTAADFYLDSTANDHDGTLVDADGDSVEVTSARVGNAVNLNGDADSIDIDSLTDANIPTTGNVSVWVNRDTESIQMRLLGIDDAFEYRMPAGGDVSYEFFHGGTGAPVSSSGGIGIEWAFLSTNYVDGGTITGYIDGAQNGTGASNGSNPVGSGFSIGTRFNGSTDYVDGVLDEIRVSSSTRSADWISAEHLNQATTTDFYTIAADGGSGGGGNAVLDRSGQGNDGIITNWGGSATTTSGAIGQAFYWDGVGDNPTTTSEYVSVPRDASLEPSDAITVSAWVKVEDFSLSPGMKVVAKSYTSGASPYQSYALAQQGSLEVARFEVNIDGTLQWTANSDLSEGEWFHLVGTWNDGEKIKLYVDGTLSKESNSAHSGTITYYDTPLIIGSSISETNQEMSGAIDDVRIYNRQLSPDEIKQLYRQGATTKIATTPSPSGPTVTLDDGLLAHYTFDGPNLDWTNTSAEIRDISGSGNHANATSTMAATTSPTSGAIGQGLQFDGVSDTISAPTDLSSTDVQTVSLWLYVDEWVNDDGTVFNNIDYDVAFDGLEVRPSVSAGTCNAGDTYISVRTGGSGPNVACYDRPTAGEWHHWLVVADLNEPDATEVAFYLDGVRQTQTWNPTPTTNVGPFDTDISHLMSLDGTSDFLEGKLDDVRIYDRALSPDEITQLYRQGATTKIATTIDVAQANSGLGSGLVGHWTFDGKDFIENVADVSGNDRDAYLFTGAASTTVRGALGQAFGFDGFNDVIIVPHETALNITGDISISTWFKLNSAPQANGSAFVAKTNDGNTDWDYGFVIWDNNLNFYSDANGLDFFGNTELNTINEWQHAVVVRRGNDYEFFLNGVSDGTDTNAGAFSTNSYPLRFGKPGDNLSGNTLDGSLDDIRLYNRALSDDEVKQLYRMGQ